MEPDAVENKHPQIASMILDRNPKIGPGRRKSICVWASTHGYDDLLLRVLDAGVKLNSARNEHGYAIDLAAKNGHCSTVNLLLDRGSYIHNSLLHAARAGQIEVLQTMIKRGIDKKITETPLFEAFGGAAEAGQLAVGQFFLDTGLNFATPKTAGWGYRTVTRAIEANQPDMVRWLFSKLDLCPDGQIHMDGNDDWNPYGQTKPMITALRFGKPEMVILLFLLGAQPLDLGDKSISDQILHQHRPGTSCKTREALEVHRTWTQGLEGTINRPVTSIPAILTEDASSVKKRPRDHCYCGKNCDFGWCRTPK